MATGTGLSPEQKRDRKRQDLLASAIQKAQETKVKREGDFHHLVTEMTRTGEDAEIEKQQLAEAAKQEGGGGGGFSMASAQPSSVSGVGGVAAEARTGLSDFLKETETESKETSTPGAASEGGLPPRTLDVTTTSEQQMGLGRANLLRLIPGLENIGTREVNATRSAPNPEFQDAKARRAVSIGDAAFRMNNGDMRPDRFAPFVQDQLQGFTPEEKREVMVRAQQTAVGSLAAQKEIDRNAAKALTTQWIKHDATMSPEISKATAAFSFARTDEEMYTATQRIQQLVRGGQVFKGEQAAAKQNAVIRDLTEANARITLARNAQAQIVDSVENKHKLAEIDFGGLMKASGVGGDMGEEQVNMMINRLPKNADKRIMASEEDIALVQSIQRNQIRLGIPVMDVEIQGNAFLKKPSKISFFDPKEHVQLMDILGDQREGNKSAAAEKLRGEGYDVTDLGDGDYTIEPKEGHRRYSALSHIQRVFINKSTNDVAGETFTEDAWALENRLPNMSSKLIGPKEKEATPKPAQLDPKGPVQGPEPPPPNFGQRFGAFLEGQTQTFINQRKEQYSNILKGTGAFNRNITEPLVGFGTDVVEGFQEERKK